MLKTMLALTFLLVATAGCATDRQSRNDARSQILTILREGTDAARNGDTTKFLERVPVDFELQHEDGSITNRDQLLQRLQQRATTLPVTISLDVTIERLRVDGDHAVVWTLQRWERIGVAGSRFAGRKVVTTQRHEELWRIRNGRWEGYRITELGGDLTVDGQLQPAPVASAPRASEVIPSGGGSASEQAVRALERRWLDAYEASDATAMTAILADDFVLTDAVGGRVSKASVIRGLNERASAGAGSIRHCTLNVISRAFDGTVVLMGMVVTERGTGAAIRRNASHYTDTYVRTGGEWKVAASQLAGSTLTVAPPCA